MWDGGRQVLGSFGGNTYINTLNLVVYKGEPLFASIAARAMAILGIDFDVFDARGICVATFRKSIVVQGDSDNFDAWIKSKYEEARGDDKASGQLIAKVRRRGAEGAEMEVSVRLYTPDGFR